MMAFNLISLVSMISMIIYLYLGINVITLDKKSNTNRLFFLMSFCLAVWAMAGFFGFSAKTKANLQIWITLGFFLGSIPYWALMLHFCADITKVIRLKPIHILCIYLPMIVLAMESLNSNILFRDFVLENGYWRFVNAPESAWYYIYLAYVTIYMASSMVFLIIWRRRSKTIREKRSSSILVSALIAVFIIGTTEAMILPALTNNKSIGLSPMVFIVWMYGIWYSMVRYRFLAITPEHVSRDILANIDESIILLDIDLKIIKINASTRKYLDIQNQRYSLPDLPDIIHEHEFLKNEIQNLIKKDIRSFSCRVHYLTMDGIKRLMDLKCNLIKDRIGDINGIIIISKEVKNVKQLETDYKITQRQADIVQHMITGLSNKNIGEVLGITERTVKGHITAIYNKLNVNNKIELIHLLKSHQLISEYSAEKTVLPTLK